MTEEQIKQNALKYATENYGEYNEHDYTDHSHNNLRHAVSEKAFIAGAHSRDEEVTALKNKLDDVTIDKYGVLGKLDICKEQVGRLQKPWINTKNENNHPKIDEQIIIAFGDNARMIIKYNGKETFEIWEAHHWMPIPPLPIKND